MTEPVKVLYVEDDADIRMVAEFALEDENFYLEVCESGIVAIRQASLVNVDLILLDVMMPDLNGPDTLVKLRELPNMAQVPVIFMTAKAQASDKEEYRALGAIGVISKPFDPMTLADDIRNLMGI